MLNCLQCGAPLAQDWGIVACTDCGAVMMVDLDGQVQLADDASSSAGLGQGPVSVPGGAPSTFGEDVIEEFSSVLPLAEPENPDLNAPESHAPESDTPIFESELEADPDSPAEVSQPQALEPAESNADLNWFDQEVGAPVEEGQASSPVPFSAGLLDVADFGNSDIEAGTLLFELTIARIDHGDLRQKVLEILSDPRLTFNVKDLANSVDRGILVIPGLNAARASLIVSRLQHLNVQLHWRQKVYEADL